MWPTSFLVGVPGYRISQMVAAGGNILDAYGLVNVVSPSGLPMRGIVGISPDPIMLVAINCDNVKESAAFYEKLGFSEQVRWRMRPEIAAATIPLTCFLLIDDSLARSIHFLAHRKGRPFLSLTSQKMQYIWPHLQIAWVFCLCRRKEGRR